MRLGFKRNTAVKKWHSRARLIDIRKTKITFLEQSEESKIDNVCREAVKEEVIATPVTVLDETGRKEEFLRESPLCPEWTDEEISATAVEIFPS